MPVRLQRRRPPEPSLARAGSPTLNAHARIAHRGENKKQDSSSSDGTDGPFKRKRKTRRGKKKKKPASADK